MYLTKFLNSKTLEAKLFFPCNHWFFENGTTKSFVVQL